MKKTILYFILPASSEYPSSSRYIEKIFNIFVSVNTATLNIVFFLYKLLTYIK